jgi:hypothetical protein
MPTGEAGISYILVGNTHHTTKKFCSDSVNQSSNHPTPYQWTKKMEKWALYKIIKTAYY